MGQDNALVVIGLFIGRYHVLGRYSESCGRICPSGILCTIIGCISIYGMLFATGTLLYGDYVLATVLFTISIVSGVSLIFLWQGIVGKQQDEQDGASVDS